MSLTLFNRGLWIGSAPPGYDQSFSTSTSFFESNTIDLGTEKFAFIGRFWHPERTSKNIHKVHWSCSLVSGGGSSIDLSLQNVSTATAPLQPDETQDQVVTFTLASISSGWQTHTLGSDRSSVAIGDLLAVVWEFNGGTRGGSDSLSIRGHRRAGFNAAGPDAAFKSGGTWTNPSTGSYPNVIFECDDGTFGTFDEGFVTSNPTLIAYNSGSSPNEYALQFDVPVEVSVDAAIVTMLLASNTASHFDIVLYEGTTALATVSFDAHTFRGTSAYGLLVPFGSDITLTPGTTYYLSLKPTSANNVSLVYFEVNATGHFDVHSGGQTWLMAHRAGGAWTNGWGSSLRRPKVSLRVCKIHNSSGPFAVHNSQIIQTPTVIGY